MLFLSNDPMARSNDRTVMQRAMHIHPTVSEFIPTMMDNLKPLQRSGSAELKRTEVGERP
jgi:hypothetical protein